MSNNSAKAWEDLRHRLDPNEVQEAFRAAQLRLDCEATVLQIAINSEISETHAQQILKHIVEEHSDKSTIILECTRLIQAHSGELIATPEQLKFLNTLSSTPTESILKGASTLLSSLQDLTSNGTS